MTTIFMPGMTIGSELGTDLGISQHSSSLTYAPVHATRAAVPAVVANADAARKWGRPPRGEPR